MQEILDDQLDNPQLTDKEIFTKIWYSPREVFRFINDNNYDNHINILLFFIGFISALNQAREEMLGIYTSLWMIMLGSALLGPFITWIAYYLYAMATSWTGKWLNGQANTAAIYKMFIYASTPTATIFFFLTPLVLVYGNALFTRGNIFTSNDGSIYWMLLALAFLEFTLGIWALVLFVIGTSEIQKISTGKALLNLFLPILIFLGPIILVLILVNVYIGESI